MYNIKPFLNESLERGCVTQSIKWCKGSTFSSKITDLILDSDNDLKYLIFPNL